MTLYEVILLLQSMTPIYKLMPHLGTILILSRIYVQGTRGGKLCILQTLSYRNMNWPPKCEERLTDFLLLVRIAYKRCGNRTDTYNRLHAHESVQKTDSKCPTYQRYYNVLNYACCNYLGVGYGPYQCTFWDDNRMSQKCNSIVELERHRTSMKSSCFVRSYEPSKVTVPNLIVTNDGCPSHKYKLIKTACCINTRYMRHISTHHHRESAPTTRPTKRRSSTMKLFSQIAYGRSSTKKSTKPNDSTPRETVASPQMSTEAVFGVAFAVIVFLLLIAITVFVILKKRKRDANANKPVVLNYSKHDFLVKRNESKIMEPQNMYDDIIDFEESCHTLGNRSSGRPSRHAIHGHATDRCPSRHGMNQRPSRHAIHGHATDRRASQHDMNRRASRHDIERYDTDRRASRHDMNQRPSRLDTSRRTSRHDIGRQSSSRRSRHDIERQGSRADTTTANMNPLEVLASVLMLGEQSSNRRSKSRQKDDDSIASYTNVGSRRSKSSTSRRKSKRRRDDVYDDYTDNKSVTQTAKRRKSSKKH